MTKLVLALVAFTLPLLAQFDTATVLGTVRDPAGLAIGRGKVTLVSLSTGIKQETTTDEQGSYQFLALKAGAYRVTAEASGFKTAIADNLTVTVNARQRVDLQLEIGSTAESVTVGAEVAMLETESSSRGTVISTQQVVNLPLNGRSYADLALLAPGVRRSSIANSRDASFNVNGMRSSQNNFVIDGVDNNSYGTSNQGFSNQVVQITPDAMQEFRLETDNFSAEFGRAGGAVINATIRSGTNAYHGSMWEYLRNTNLNATGFFKPVQNRKPVLIQNQFGAAFGGPIKKEKMFFFADYEGFRRVTRSIQFATLPSLEQRQGNLGIPIMNPYTGEVYSNGVIPQRDITRFASAVLADLPAPNRAGTANNFQDEPRGTSQVDKGDIRYDHYFSSNFTGFLRYSHRLMNNLEPPAIPGASGGNANGNVRVMNWQWAFGGTWTLDPTSLFEFRMGVSQTEGGKFPLFVGTPTIGTRFNIPNTPNDPRFTGGIPAQSINGFSQLGVQSSNPQFQNPFVLNPKFNYAKIAGKHSIKLGYEHQQIQTDIDDFNPKYGSNSYAGRFSRPTGSTTNNDLQFLADFLFGARSNYQLNNAEIVNYRQLMHFMYVQDDFKVNRKLTLNVGLRYEFATPQYEHKNRLANFDAVNNTMLFAKNGSVYDRALVHPDRNNLAPRVGLAYTLTPKTVIRSAYGISYIHFNRLGGENLLAYNLPFILNPIVDQLAPTVPGSGQRLCGSNAQDPFTCFRPMEQGYPDNFLSLQNIRPLGVRTNYIPGDMPSAYTQSWHLTIQRELWKQFVLDVAYVGNRSVNLMILGDYNQSVPNNPGQNLTLQARRPLQNFGFIQVAFPSGFLNYHAFQAKVERRFSGGIYFLNSFTWSKAIDNASGHLEANNGDNSRVNYRDLRNERGPSGYDQRLNNVTTMLFDVPFGKGRKWSAGFAPANYALGGWRLALINTAQSGLPVNLSYSPSAQFQVSGAPTYRPNIIGNPLMPEGQRTAERWLDPAAVVLPTDPSRPFGNAGRNAVRGPALHSLNFGLHKDFDITERHKIEFRMEAFNFLNRTNFGPPNANRSSGAYGSITSLATSPREIQLALRFAF